MSDTRHLCPCCHKTVTRTKAGAIHGHYDKARSICPASYRDWDITITSETRTATP